MSEKGVYSPAVRRIITFVLFAGITAALLSIYYLVYLPNQHEQFNQRAFRILRELSKNFSQRVANYGIAYSNAYIAENDLANKDSIIKVSSVNLKAKDLASALKRSFKGDAEAINQYHPRQKIVNDSIIYEIRKETGGKADTLLRTAGKSLGDILGPLIAIHANAFESVLLVRQEPDTTKAQNRSKDYDPILYQSAKSTIVNINIDSLLPVRKIQGAAVADVNLEGVKYKMFVVPFHLTGVLEGTLVLAGLIPESDYRKESQAIPVHFLFGVGFLLILLLLVLPLLKVFILSIDENINIGDVRMILAVIFIIPFVISLFVSAIWLYRYPEQFSTKVLSWLQDSVKSNFYSEIKSGINQAKNFDAIVNNPAANFNIPATDTVKHDSLKTHLPLNIPGIDSLDAKDFFFYPKYDKSIENVHWMNAAGNDIASWGLINSPATYFQLKDRQYFRDILFHRGNLLPGSTDTFSILPTLSRLTGDFTINVAIPSHTIFTAEKKAVAVAISTKMNSVYNTVVPTGYAYCIIDEPGNVLVHSDTARNLHENLFEETSDNHLLRQAIGHKDSTVIDGIDLYDHPVKMMIKPMPGLPYYLVTYYDQRSEYLFIIHILAFVFLCQSVILLFISLFSYFIMIADRKIYKLHFIPGSLHWIKPSSGYKDYYTKNIVLLLVALFFVFLFIIPLPQQFHYLYMLNVSLLLPLFAVTGYYIINRGRKFLDHYESENKKITTLFFNREQFLEFVGHIRNALLLYILSVLIYAFCQNALLYSPHCNNTPVKAAVWPLIVIMPFVICAITILNLQVLKTRIKLRFKKSSFFQSVAAFYQRNSSNYLAHFIVSLFVAVTVISVIPSVTFTSYALHEERKLHFQTFQIELAKKIQQRRNDLNNKRWQTKILRFPKDGKLFIDSLKFNPTGGLYLYKNKLDTFSFWSNTPQASGTCSQFYKHITQFLFLPPDHDEFYDNPTHQQFYYWQEVFYKRSPDSLNLFYKNMSDYRTPVSISLKATLENFYLFRHVTRDYRGALLLLTIFVFIIAFYRAIYSIAKRIFLIGFFDTTTTNDNAQQEQDKPWLKLQYSYIKIEDLCKSVFPIDTPSTFAEVRQKENEVLKNDRNFDEVILRLHMALSPVYDKIWKDCSDIEKFTLYNFALDGFSNYKRVIVLYQLFDKGLFVKEHDNITVMTKSFRNFLITKDTDLQIKAMSKSAKGSWSILRTVFYIILIAVAIFIFVSQEEASKRLLAVVSSLTVLLPAILKLFDKSTVSSGSTKTTS
jgi:hypothetical protein